MSVIRRAKHGLAATLGLMGVLGPGRFGRGAAAIFTFHRIEGADHPDGIVSSTESVTESLFDDFCRIVAQECEPLSLFQFCDHLKSRRPFPRRACLISFDDGWRDNYLLALPILRRYGLPAVVFIPTAFIGTTRRFWQDEVYGMFQQLRRRRQDGRLALAPEVIGDVVYDLLESPEDRVWFYAREAIERLKPYPAAVRQSVIAELSRWVNPDRVSDNGARAFIDWNEASEMERAGVAFGSHTVNHLPLTQIDDETVAMELQTSSAGLLDHLDGRPLTLAYPNGLHNPAVRAAARDAGYLAAFTTDHGVVTVDDDPLALNRIDVTPDAVSRDGATVDRSLMALELTRPVLAMRRRRHDPNRPRPGKRPPVARRIRLLFLINHMLSEGGTERQLVELLNGLDPERYETWLACFSVSDWLKTLDVPSTIVDLNIHSLRSPVVFLRLARFIRFLRRERIDIVHTFFPDASLVGSVTGVVGGVTRRITSRRNFVDTFMTPPQRLVKSLNHRIAVNSFSVKKRTTELEGVDSRMVDVVYNGVDMTNFAALDDPNHPDRLRTRQELGIPADAPVVGIVANLRPVKGLNYFVDAAAQIHTQHPNVHFAVVGSGGLLESLSHQACDRGLQHHLHFCGRTGNVTPYLAMFDVAVLSSLSEGFSNAILEYMAAALPVVATDVGSNWEAIDHGQTGYIVPAENPEEIAIAVSRLLDDPARARAMGLAGRKRVKTYFGIERMVAEYERYYTELLETDYPRPRFRV